MPFVLGLNHQTAPVSLREKLALIPAALPEALAALQKNVSLKEAVMLSTCNRFEVYVRSDTREKTRQALQHYLTDILATPVGSDCLYYHEGEEAVKHLFRVAAGLDSLVTGENEILGQVKEAYQIAHQKGLTGKLLNVLFQRSLYVGKRVRTETGLSIGSASVASVAVTMAGRIFGDLAGRRVLVLGAGQMAELAVKHLLSQKVESIAVANRTFEHAVDLAKTWGGSALTWEEGLRHLAWADIVIGSVSVAEPVIRRVHLEQVLDARRGRSLFIIDIAVPRCIDPAIQALDNVYVFNLDDLQKVVDENTIRRTQEISKAEDVIDRETLEFARWLRAHHEGLKTGLRHG